MPNSLVPYLVGLTLYFVFHSLLASRWLKQRINKHIPRFMPAYRLSFNIIATILLLPLLLYLYQNPGELIWEWQGSWAIMMNILALLAVSGFLISLNIYDGMTFLGWRQWRDRYIGSEDPETFRISYLHRFVRHPWYCFLLIIIWTRDMYFTYLCTTIFASLYLLIGSKLEERKLIQQFGDAYQLYSQRVPGLMPLPWRYLTKHEAHILSQQNKMAGDPT